MSRSTSQNFAAIIENLESRRLMSASPMAALADHPAVATAVTVTKVHSAGITIHTEADGVFSGEVGSFSGYAGDL